jgi:hypothetical protein
MPSATRVITPSSGGIVKSGVWKYDGVLGLFYTPNGG